MKKSVLIAGLLMLLCIDQVAAQSGDGIRPLTNRIAVRQDSRIDRLVEAHVESNTAKNGIDGYRVQVLSLGSKKEAERIKMNILSAYSGLDVYMQFQSSYFVVKVGDLRTKSDALKLKERLKKGYPNAIIVPDIINFPKLKAN